MKALTTMKCGVDISGTTTGITGRITMEPSGTAMTTENHDHSEYEVTTGLLCGDCGETESACAMCGKSLHKCAQVKNPKITKGFRQIPSFPDYMVNSQATVRHIESGRYCLFVRVSKTGGAMINLSQDGNRHTKAAQDLRDEAFDPPHIPISCATCDHHPDNHFRNTDECLRSNCKCQRYVRRTA